MPRPVLPARAEQHVGMRRVDEWVAELGGHAFDLADRWTYLNGMVPGRWRGAWLPECALVTRKAPAA